MHPDDWIIIPARYQASRLPGKPLARIGSKPMICHVLDRARETGAEHIVVATDDERIQEAVQQEDCRAVLTSEGHESGSDRLAEVVDFLGLPDDAVIINLQGDEPMMPPALLTQVAQLLREQPDAGIATLMVPIVEHSEFANPDVVKVVANNLGQALYFSRSPIPFHRDRHHGTGEQIDMFGFRHLGLYAYRAGFLRQFVAMPSPEIERFEKLEQLRALAMGATIAIAVAEQMPPAGVDTQADLDRIRTELLD